MIEKPYKKALDIPFERELDCLVKKLTVIGIIGKTQGVSKANKPPPKPLMKIDQKLSPSATLFDFEVLSSSSLLEIVAVFENHSSLISTLKSTSSGGKHCEASQAW